MNTKTSPTLLRRSLLWMGTLLVAFVVLLGALYLGQRHLVYFPNTQPFDPARWVLGEMAPLPVVGADGLTLQSWFAPPRTPDKMTIVFFQGNAGPVGARNYKIRPLLDAGYGVALVGYHGFGNPGVPSEEALYADAEATVKALSERGIPEEGLVFYGESLGTAVATHTAVAHPLAAGLILESPFTSLADVGAVHYPFVPVKALLKDRYPTIDIIRNLRSPLLLVHGEADRVVPVRMARRLFAAAPLPKRAFFRPEAGHNDLHDAQVQEIILSFLEGLSTAALCDQIRTCPKRNAR